jgi:hypothetical protein
MFCSLENAGESSVLPILRSLRLLFELVAKVTPNALVSCSNVIDAQVYFIAGYLFCVLYIQFTVLPLIEWILGVLVSIG